MNGMAGTRPRQPRRAWAPQSSPDESESESLPPQPSRMSEHCDYTVEQRKGSKLRRLKGVSVAFLAAREPSAEILSVVWEGSLESRIALNFTFSCNALGTPLNQLYLNQDGIKRGRVAHVGKFFCCPGVDA